MSQRYILNILGGFGSGKSSLARAFRPDQGTIPPAECRQITFAEAYKECPLKLDPEVRPNKVLATIYPKHDLAFVGPYTTNCGGCDALVKVEIFAALEWLVQFTDCDIIFEGVAVSGVRTYLRWIEQLPMMYKIKPLVIALHAPVEVHAARVALRNGGKETNPKHLADKHRSVSTRILELMDTSLTFTVIDEDTIVKTYLKAKTFVLQNTQ